MFAHVNVWRLTDRGAEWKDDAGRVIGAALREQPGFRSYTLVRTGEWELVVITVFETQAQLDGAVDAVAPLVRQLVAPVADDVVERRQGAVLFHLAASPAERQAA